MISTATTLFSTLSLWLFLTVGVANLSFSYATIRKWANQTIHQTSCIPIEREALLEFKKHLKDSSNRLATWDAAAARDDDCCSWYGVSCHDYLGESTTQYVTGLHLRSLSEGEFYDRGIYSNWDHYIFGGKVSSALLSLKHLRYLDLSYNDFGGMSIPSFLGSMRSLRYLNLSNAGLGGMIPHQLGNLSNLQYLNLDISGYFTYAYGDIQNLQWMSGLSSLKFLDLSGWNLSKVLNWDKVILTTLPSLLQLHLSDCQLPSPQLLANNINASSISILYLSHNYIGKHPTIFLRWVSGLKILNSLDLVSNSFQGSIPRELKNLSSLREVYLDMNSFNSSIPNWLYGSHTILDVLSLSQNQLSSFQPQSSSQSVNNFSSLSVLDLSSNNFQGPIPNEIQNMTSLQKLYLLENMFSSHVPNWLDGLTRLEHLHLSENNLEGKISIANWNMPSLISLDMSLQSGNKLELEGGIPKSFKNYCNLRWLNLGGVKLKQEINQVLEILSLPGCASNGLEWLSLDRGQLFGNLTTTNHYFDRLMSLTKLDFRFNNLSGTLPVKFGGLEKLEKLYLGGNSLAGDVLEDHFENLKYLRYFSASGNQLKLRVSPNWVPPFVQMLILELGSWHIGPQFPTWLRSLKNLRSLDLSNSDISSSIPVWFWNFSSTVNLLNLSHNQLHGVLPRTLPHFLDLSIDMSSNLFHGPLPLVSSNLYVLEFSNNSFSGSISKFLCISDFNSSGVDQNLLYLNLGQNHLHGKIPNCLTTRLQLVVINLSNNEFNGTIPESIGTLLSLQSLHLGNNRLSGKLPSSLKECTKLITIDVGENELVGNISSFVSAESLSGMKILILRSNKLSGQLTEKLCHATSLHVLDLADNLFNGNIPSCLGNLSAMAKMNESTGVIQISDSYPYMIETTLLRLKRNMLEYNRNLAFVRSLDMSSNKLCGKIPDEITMLYALVSLNLSHNDLSGGIPKNIGFMQELDSIDLSANQLSGEIPPSISNLTSLGKLNLSHNKLSGRIPFGNQIQTFDASSFVDNELCGSPLPIKCSNDVVPNDANVKGGEDDNDGDGIIWFYVSLAFGFVVGFWCLVGPLLLSRSWRFAYYQFLDRMWDKIWWKLHRFGIRWHQTRTLSRRFKYR